MNCTEARPLLGPFLDEEVPRAVRGQIERHLETCPACRAEYARMAELAAHLAVSASAPPQLWTAIEARLHNRPRRFAFGLSRRIAGIAAGLAAVVGLGLLAWSWGLPFGASPAQAASVDFGLLLSDLHQDARAAFERFLAMYNARAATEAEARRHGATLNFAIPQHLAGGFERAAVYVLDFGTKPGVAVRYGRNGEFLAVIFHPPVLEEDYGTHEDRECVVGKHRGHAVEVGEWALVHIMDPSTCHCILSRLDPMDELPAVVADVVPNISNIQPAHP